MARRRIPQSVRDEVFAQTGGACFYCGMYATDLDHIRPYSYSQDDSERNLVPACSICNSIAGNQHFESLFAKKEYILAERDTLHWRRKLEAMVVTMIPVDVLPYVKPKPEPVFKPKPEPRPVTVREPRVSKRVPPKPLRRKDAPVVRTPATITPQPTRKPEHVYTYQRPEFLWPEDGYEDEVLTDEEIGELMRFARRQKYKGTRRRQAWQRVSVSMIRRQVGGRVHNPKTWMAVNVAHLVWFQAYDRQFALFTLGLLYGAFAIGPVPGVPAQAQEAA